MIHAIILAGLGLIGFTLLTMEALSPHSPGGLIREYTFTKLYWLGLGGYALISTLLVLLVGFYQKSRKRSLTGKAVMLAHVIQVGLAWAFISLGLHDLIQDAWSSKNKGLGATLDQAQHEGAAMKRPPIPVTPLSKSHQYKAADTVSEPEKQQNE